MKNISNRSGGVKILRKPSIVFEVSHVILKLTDRKGGRCEMREYKSVVITLIAAIGAMACVSIFTGGLVNYKKSGGGSGITATGSASSDFEADLIVWKHTQGGIQRD